MLADKVRTFLCPACGEMFPLSGNCPECGEAFSAERWTLLLVLRLHENRDKTGRIVHQPFAGGATYNARIYRKGGRFRVLFVEYQDNPGASITNAVEKVATEVLAYLKVSPATVEWCEFYAHGEGTPDRVTFEWDGKKLSSPAWKRWETFFEETEPEIPWSKPVPW